MPRVWMCVASIVPLLLQAVPAAKTEVCFIDPCQSSASSAGGVLLVCPVGDGPTLSSIGAMVSVTLEDCGGAPVQGIPAQNFWIQGKADPQLLCGGSLSSSADAATDLSGQTTMSGSIAAGGYLGDGVYAVAEGYMIQGTDGLCDNPLPLVLVSPDINGDLVVGLADLAIFATAFPSGGGTVDPRMDFNGDGKIDAADLSLFAVHFLHRCE